VTTPAPSRAADNPFAAERIDGLAVRPRGWTWDALLARLTALDSRGAVIGPHGSGKTTLLEELGRRLGPDRSVHVRILTDGPRPVARTLAYLPPSEAVSRIVLADGAERLSAMDWWRLRVAWRRASGLVITAHAPGRLPTLVEMRTDPALLRELVMELAPDDAERLAGSLDDLFRRHRGDIRSCLRELYDRQAGR
jgi:hypothetical protein